MLALRQSVNAVSLGVRYKLWFMGLIYLDLLLTLFAMQAGLTELNPYMVRLLSNPQGLVLVKVVAPLIIAFLVPGRLLLPSIGFMLAVSAWNLSELLTLLG